MQETQIWSLGQEDPLEKEMTTHYTVLAWEIPEEENRTEELGGLQFIGLQKNQKWLSNSVQFSSSVVSDSLQPHGLQHARLPCPSPIPELVQTHVHGVGDAMQPSHPLSSPPPPAFNLAQYQGLLQWVNTSHQVAKVLEFHLQHQSFQWIFRTGFLWDWLVWPPCSPRDF